MARKIGLTWQRLIALPYLSSCCLLPLWWGQARHRLLAMLRQAQLYTIATSKYCQTVASIMFLTLTGSKNVLHEPPDGFTPVMATAAQLAEYGFPPQPKDAAGLAAWTSKWSRFKVKRSASDPVLTTMTSTESVNKVSPEVNPLINIGYYQTWSGYGDYVVGSNAFADVLGEYYQPTYGSSPSGAQQLSWVGLGGLHGEVAVTGWIRDERIGEFPTYYAWYGYVNSSGTSTFNTYSGTVNAGDDIEVQTFWNPSSNYPAAFTFFDFNTMTNFYVTSQLTSSYYDGEMQSSLMDGLARLCLLLITLAPVGYSAKTGPKLELASRVLHLQQYLTWNTKWSIQVIIKCLRPIPRVQIALSQTFGIAVRSL